MCSTSHLLSYSDSVRVHISIEYEYEYQHIQASLMHPMLLMVIYWLVAVAVSQGGTMDGSHCLLW